ncbi:MAG: glycosyltransferase family 4 protein [Treponema sp.]|jgi:glycosyltransferase involved in cell wall biosynthesis|nr:glycosyltransferase family 4 protein [Treponema sp.]
MNIAFNIQPLLSDTKTGVGYAEEHLVKALIAQNASDTFFLEFFSQFEKNVEKVNFYLKENVRTSICSFFYWELYRLISALFPLPYWWFFRTKADVAHFFNFIVPPGVKGKKIVTIHDLAFRRFPETVRAKTKYMLKWGLAKAIKRADRIIAVSEWTKREILRFYRYPAERIDVVYNGVDPCVYRTMLDPMDIERVRKRRCIPESYILYLGTIEPRKNLERLIKAYSLLKSKHPDSPALVLAGKKGWCYERIIQAYEESAARESIIWIGYVAEEEKPFLLAGAIFFCFPSLYEGFGMPILEAFACGTPVLTANNSSLAEIAGDAAFFVDALSIQDICDKLEQMYINVDVRANLRQKGLERVKQFSWEKSAEKLHSIYETVLKEEVSYG